MTAGASSAVKPERLMPESVSMGAVNNSGSLPLLVQPVSENSGAL